MVLIFRFRKVYDTKRLTALAISMKVTERKHQILPNIELHPNRRLLFLSTMLFRSERKLQRFSSVQNMTVPTIQRDLLLTLLDNLRLFKKIFYLFRFGPGWEGKKLTLLYLERHY